MAVLAATHQSFHLKFTLSPLVVCTLLSSEHFPHGEFEMSVFFIIQGLSYQNKTANFTIFRVCTHYFSGSFGEIQSKRREEDVKQNQFCRESILT